MPRMSMISSAVWTDLKRRWRAGEFITVTQMHKFAKGRYQGQKVPSIVTIQHRMSDEGDWAPGIADLEEQQKYESLAQQCFQRKGFTHEKIVDKIVAGLNGADELIQSYSRRAKDATGDTIPEVLAAMEEARTYQLAWIREYKDLTGAVAPTKRILEIDLEAKWRVAQDEEANKAYLLRKAKIEAAKRAAVDGVVEEIDSEVDENAGPTHGKEAK